MEAVTLRIVKRNIYYQMVCDCHFPYTSLLDVDKEPNKMKAGHFDVLKIITQVK